MWQIGDLVDWDGIFFDGRQATQPRVCGRIVSIGPTYYIVDWPRNPNFYHYFNGTAQRFRRHVMDDFDITGVE